MGEFSPLHWLLVIAIALLLFGTTKFAAVGKGLRWALHRGDFVQQSTREKYDLILLRHDGLVAARADVMLSLQARVVGQNALDAIF